MRHKWQPKRKGKTMWDKSIAVLRGWYLFLQSLFTPGLLASCGYNCFSSAYTVMQWWPEMHTVALNLLPPELFQPPLHTKVYASSRPLALKSILETPFHTCAPLPYPRLLPGHKMARSLTLRRGWGAVWAQFAFWANCMAHHGHKLEKHSLKQWTSSWNGSSQA